MTKDVWIERAKEVFPNNPEMVEWIEALLSGEYQQTTGALCKSGGFCCIGVGARVILKKRQRDIETTDLAEGENSKRVHIKDTYKSFESMLHDLGLSINTYIDVNDDREPFEDIAKRIVLDRLVEVSKEMFSTLNEFEYFVASLHERGLTSTEKWSIIKDELKIKETA